MFSVLSVFCLTAHTSKADTVTPENSNLSSRFSGFKVLFAPGEQQFEDIRILKNGTAVVSGLSLVTFAPESTVTTSKPRFYAQLTPYASPAHLPGVEKVLRVGSEWEEYSNVSHEVTGDSDANTLIVGTSDVLGRIGTYSVDYSSDPKLSKSRGCFYRFCNPIKVPGLTTSNRLTAVTSDLAGNVIATGRVFKAGKIDGIFVSKVDKNGKLLWRHDYQSEFPLSTDPELSVSASGDIFVAMKTSPHFSLLSLNTQGLQVHQFTSGGEVKNSFEIETQTEGIPAALKVKASSDASVVWVSNTMDTYAVNTSTKAVQKLRTSSGVTKSLATDKDGTLFELHENFSDNTSFVSAYNAEGQVLWSEKVNKKGFFPKKLAVDSNGMLWVAGIQIQEDGKERDLAIYFLNSH
jgi:hypothetical protein